MKLPFNSLFVKHQLRTISKGMATRHKIVESAVVTLAKSQARVQIHFPQCSSFNNSVSLSHIQQFPPLVQWLETLDDQLFSTKDDKERVIVDEITIQSVDMFGSGKIGFLKFITTARMLPSGKHVPGIVFMRGGAVAILIILRTSSVIERKPSYVDDDSYVLLTEQPRIPVPNFKMLELPAGMLDGESGNFSGTAAKEIYEETGLQIEPHELIDLTKDIAPNNGLGLYPSAGGCDEFIRLFACEKVLAEDELNQLKGKLAGLREHGEFITLRLVKLKDLWKSTQTMHATSALYLWDRMNSSSFK